MEVKSQKDSSVKEDQLCYRQKKKETKFWVKSLNSNLSQTGPESLNTCTQFSPLRIVHVSWNTSNKYVWIVGKEVDEFERDFQKTRDNVLQMKAQIMARDKENNKAKQILLKEEIKNTREELLEGLKTLKA